MSQPFDFEAVARAALAQCRDLLPRWLPAGKLVGREFMVGNLRGDLGDSLRINVTSGRWSDFGSGGDDKGRDLVALYAAIHGLPMIEAGLELGAQLGVVEIADLERYRAKHGAETPRRVVTSAPRRPEAEAPPLPVDKWEPETPVPADAPPLSLRHGKYGDPSHVARILDAEGRLLCAVVRFDLGDGKKDVLPRTFGTLTNEKNPRGKRGWHWKGPAVPRPLYGLDLLAAAPPAWPVLVVEGEKKAEAARRMLAVFEVVVVSWMGGGNGVGNADWSPLRGRAVYIWPDNDEPGLKAAAAIAGHVLAAGAESSLALPVPQCVPAKWDLGDAEAEGWDGARVWNHVVEASRRRGAEEPKREGVEERKREGAETPKREGVEEPQPGGAAASLTRDPSAPLYSPTVMAPPPPEAEKPKRRPTKAEKRAAADAAEAEYAERDGHGYPDRGPPDPAPEGGGRWPEDVVADLWSAPDAPVRPVGHLKGRYWLFDSAGQLRDLGAADLVKRAALVELCGSRAWLQDHYAKPRKDGEPGLAVEEAGEDLIFACQAIGLYSPTDNPERRPGIWADEQGRPLVHLGDVLLFADGTEMDAGRMYGGGVYPRSARQNRPAPAAGPEAARELLDGLETLWSWKEGGHAARLILGWMGTALLGAAAPWRPNVFLCGPAGTGKSKLVAVIRKALLLHAYTNDASKAGIEQSVSNRPGPIIIDEAAEADKGERAQALVGMLRAMTQGDGAKGSRGTSDGVGRSFSVLGSVMFAATMAPPMESQDEHRVTLLELAKPNAGSPDNSAPMDALAMRAQALAPALFGRMLAGFDRWKDCLHVFRKALVAAGCAARQADQLGPQLAGWWVLCFDGVPDEDLAAGAVEDVRGYVVTADEAAEDDAPQRARVHLLTSRVATDRAGERRLIGELLLSAFSLESPDWAKAWLRTAGIEVSLAAPYRGVWIARRHADLESVFNGTTFKGYVWAAQLARLPGAFPLKGTNKRIGGYSGRVIFIPEFALRLTGDGATPTPIADPEGDIP